MKKKLIVLLVVGLYLSIILQSKVVICDPEKVNKDLLEPVTTEELLEAMEAKIQAEKFISQPDNLSIEKYDPINILQEKLEKNFSKDKMVSYTIALREEGVTSPRKLYVVVERGKVRLLRDKNIGVYVKGKIVFFIDFIKRKYFPFGKMRKNSEFMEFYKKYAPLIWLDKIRSQLFVESGAKSGDYESYYLFTKTKDNPYGLRGFWKKSKLSYVEILQFPEKNIVEKWKVEKFSNKGKLKFNLKNFSK